MSIPAETIVKDNRWNRTFLGGLTPEQRRLRKIRLQRDWQKRNKRKMQKARNVWLQKFRKKFILKNLPAKIPKPLFRNPLNDRAVFLYRSGYTSPAIAEMLNISKGNVRALVWRAGVKRESTHRVRNALQKEATINRLIVDAYRQERQASKFFNEGLYWLRHPEYIKWLQNKKSETHRKTSLKNGRKYYQARLAVFLAKFKCRFCQCDGSKIAPKRQKIGLKYCSNACSIKAGIVAQKIRLQLDPEFSRRRSEIRKKCYRRTRLERPEIYKAEVRRKLENPQYRIAKAHRTRIYLLVKEGKMVKTQTSLKYFGCTRSHLKEYLVKQFKPGMTWENYGEVWHVDHIIPLHSFDLLNPADCAIAFNWQNLQPMFARLNSIKSKKVTHPQQPLPLIVY